jgi:methionyl-tRNA formyltransferase
MRIVVLTNGNFFARLILERLVAERSGEIVKIFTISGDYKGRSGLAALFHFVRATTWPYVIFKIAARLATRGEGVRELARRYGIETEDVVAVETARKSIEAARPDLLVSVSCPQILAESILRLAPLGGINIHASLLPRYAGLAPYFWVLAEGETRTGVTVHFMTRRVDFGNVLGVAEVAIEPRDSAFSLFTRLARAGAPLLADAVDRVLVGDRGTPMRGESTYRSHPDFAAWRRLRRNGHRLGRQR